MTSSLGHDGDVGVSSGINSRTGKVVPVMSSGRSLYCRTDRGHAEDDLSH